MTAASESKFDSIVALLAASSAAIGAVAKNERNTQGSGFNFRGIDTVVNATSPEFREHGIIVVPTVIGRDYEQLNVGSKGSLVGHVMLRTRFTFYGPAGDSIEATVESEAMDSGDKATAKAMSVGLRTALLQVLMLPTDEPDPDATSYERAPATAAAATTAPAAPSGLTASETAVKENFRAMGAACKENGTRPAVEAAWKAMGAGVSRQTLAGFASLQPEERAKLEQIARTATQAQADPEPVADDAPDVPF